MTSQIFVRIIRQIPSAVMGASVEACLECVVVDETVFVVTAERAKKSVCDKRCHETAVLTWRDMMSFAMDRGGWASYIGGPADH